MDFKWTAYLFMILLPTFQLCSAVREDVPSEDTSPEKRSIFGLFPSAAKQDDDNKRGIFGLIPSAPKKDDENQKQPGILGLFSPRPKTDDTDKTSGGFRIGGQLKNPLTGSSVGFHFEVNPSKVAHDAIDDFTKRLVPGHRPQPGQNKPKPDVHKGIDKSHPDDSKTEVPKKDSLDWDDIGEPKEPDVSKPEVPPSGHMEEAKGSKPGLDADKDSFEESDYSEVPIEDIIQPRGRSGRPKRFIESKIYHVPLLFRSNAKPYRVDIQPKANRLQPKLLDKDSAIS